MTTDEHGCLPGLLMPLTGSSKTWFSQLLCVPLVLVLSLISLNTVKLDMSSLEFNLDVSW